LSIAILLDYHFINLRFHQSTKMFQRRALK
jgi:hypothetical protein